MNSSSLQSLQEKVRGHVITADHPDYDTARAVYNGMIDKRPAAVLQVSQVADVITAVNFARDEGMDVALRGGGHSAPGFGTCDGGLVIDFVNRRGVRVDPASATARAETGATWADFNHATNAFGLATTGGIIGSTGVAGLTLGAASAISRGNTACPATTSSPRTWSRRTENSASPVPRKTMTCSGPSAAGPETSGW